MSPSVITGLVTPEFRDGLAEAVSRKPTWQRLTARRILLAILAAALFDGGIARAAPVCDAPDVVSRTWNPLSHVADALRPNSQLNVLAVGSASLFKPETTVAPTSLLGQTTAGTPSNASAPPPAQVITDQPSAAAFPAQMANALEAAVPGSHVTLVTRGGRGLAAADQLALLNQALAQGHYDLVLWQTGTVEAVRNTPPAQFTQILTAGATAVKQASADLVLIDPQFSRFLPTSSVEPYEKAFVALATDPGVVLFPRYALMQSWAAAGRLDLERTPKPDRQKAAEQLHACLGEQLARLVQAATR